MTSQKTLSTKPKFQWRTVYQDQNVILKISRKPPAWYCWVRPAAVLIPVDESGRILLMHEYKSTTKQWGWGFPGGIIEPRERAAQAARRECAEELGMLPRLAKKLTVVKSNFPFTSVTYFLGFGLKKVPPRQWGTEKIGSVKKFSLNQIHRLALDGKILDPRSIVAIARLQREVRRGTVRLRK